MWLGLAFQNFVHPEYIVELKYITENSRSTDGSFEKVYLQLQELDWMVFVTIFAIANGRYALRGQSHPCIICFLHISAQQYIQDELTTVCTGEIFKLFQPRAQHTTPSPTPMVVFVTTRGCKSVTLFEGRLAK